MYKQATIISPDLWRGSIEDKFWKVFEKESFELTESPVCSNLGLGGGRLGGGRLGGGRLGGGGLEGRRLGRNRLWNIGKRTLRRRSLGRGTVGRTLE